MRMLRSLTMDAATLVLIFVVCLMAAGLGMLFVSMVCEVKCNCSREPKAEERPVDNEMTSLLSA